MVPGSKGEWGGGEEECLWGFLGDGRTAQDLFLIMAHDLSQNDTVSGSSQVTMGAGCDLQVDWSQGLGDSDSVTGAHLWRWY